MFHEELDGGVGDDGLTVVSGQKIFDVLGDGGDPEVVFVGAFGEGVEEGGGVGVFHEIPGFINDQKPFFEVFFDFGPDVVENDKHGDGAEGLLEFFDAKNGKLVFDVEV